MDRWLQSNTKSLPPPPFNIDQPNFQWVKLFSLRENGCPHGTQICALWVFKKSGFHQRKKTFRVFISNRLKSLICKNSKWKDRPFSFHRHVRPPRNCLYPLKNEPLKLIVFSWKHFQFPFPGLLYEKWPIIKKAKCYYSPLTIIVVREQLTLPQGSKFNLKLCPLLFWLDCVFDLSQSNPLTILSSGVRS